MAERVKNERAESRAESRETQPVISKPPRIKPTSYPAVFREEVHFRHLQIRIFSTGVVGVHSVYLVAVGSFGVCFLVLHRGATCMYLCMFHLPKRHM